MLPFNPKSGIGRVRGWCPPSLFVNGRAVLISEQRGNSRSAARTVEQPAGLSQTRVQRGCRSLSTRAASLLRNVYNHLNRLPSIPTACVLSVSFKRTLGSLIQLLDNSSKPIVMGLKRVRIIVHRLTPVLIIISQSHFPSRLTALLGILVLLDTDRKRTGQTSARTLLSLHHRCGQTFRSITVVRTLLGLTVSDLTPAPRDTPRSNRFLGEILALVHGLLTVPSTSRRCSAAGMSLTDSFKQRRELIIDVRGTQLLRFLVITTKTYGSRQSRQLFTSRIPLLIRVFRYLFQICSPSSVTTVRDFSGSKPRKYTTRRTVRGRIGVGEPVQRNHFSKSMIIHLSMYPSEYLFIVLY